MHVSRKLINTYEYFDLSELQVKPNGDVIQIKKYPPGSSPPDTNANAPIDKLFQPLEDGRSGYLIRAIQGDDTYAKQYQRQIKSDEGYPTIWERPGKPPISIPVRFDEIDSGQYIAFLDKYLLNAGDTSGSSDTNSHTGGVWKRPYEFTPTRLLAQDGSIVEIPYPEFVFEYGIGKRIKKDTEGRNFSIWIPTRAGTVISKDREHGSALYLYKDNQLYLIAGGKTVLGVDLASNSAEGIWTTRLSPDGCKIAYSHLEKTESSSAYSAPHVFSIINVCKDAQ